MYWIFLIIFILSVLVPDIIRSDVSFLTETRLEEIAIFLLGGTAFVIFMIKEKQLLFHEKEIKKNQKTIDQTIKDLVESYSYIGEVNRKIDILMNTALGFSTQEKIDSKYEKETYSSIVNATETLLKANYVCLRFIDVKTGKTKKDFCLSGKRNLLKNSELLRIEKGVNVEKIRNCLAISSEQIVKGVRSFLIICDYEVGEENSPKNLEILKVFASQALFLFSYARDQGVVEKNEKDCDCN